MGSTSMVEQWLAVSRKSGTVGATDDELDAAAAALGVALPADYCEMMRKVDGGEADFGDSWIRFWPAGALDEHNAFIVQPKG